MPGRADLLIAGILIALCTYVVLAHWGVGPLGAEADPPPVLALGERLEVGFRLRGIGDAPTWHDVAELFGARATVLMSWSIKCPCVAKVEERLRAVYAATGGPGSGVAWVAYNGEPGEDHRATRAQMARQRAFYHMLMDPRQQLARRLGVTQATQVAILDGAGRLVYRGAIDDDYEGGDARFVREALEDLLAGRAPRRAETPWAYGCGFDDPASCLEYAAPGPAGGRPGS